jgi:hypothetical protein
MVWRPSESHQWGCGSCATVIRSAIVEPDRLLRSLGAIHLATARLLGPELTALLTYDDRLAKAAADAGIAVLAPR